MFAAYTPLSDNEIMIYGGMLDASNLTSHAFIFFVEEE